MDLATAWIVAASAALVAVLGAAHVGRRRWRQARDAAALAERRARNQHLPRSLHPVIDPNVCIGSLSCVKACPEGDILGVVDGAGALIHGDHCIGHGRCAAECPVDAIKLVFGTLERGVDLPEVDAFFESSRPGVHIVGELAGMGLIKNAVRQGVQVAERLDQVLSREPANGAVDVAVVGAGPAGLATALALSQRGRSCRLLEQGSVGGTVAHFPRQKLVMTEPLELPPLGRFDRRTVEKEELLATFQRAVREARLAVEEGVKVTGVTGEDGAFRVDTDQGPVAARKVVLAVGRRGSPRKLGVPGEEREKVVYALDDPAQYEGARVLVVGGGDAAVEAAAQLAEESTAEVTLSYRGPELTRCREKNRARLAALAQSGRVRLLLESEVTEVGETRVALTVKGHREVLANDHVIVNVGGELPLDLLERSGVALRRYHGEAPGGPRGAEPPPPTDERRRETRARWAAASLYVLAGGAILAWLAWHGADYYRLPRLARLHSPLHPSLRSSGPFGHGIGIVATGFMLSNFLYAARKRSRALTGFGSIRAWLDFHVFVGFMSPLVIAFHAAFQSKNLLATGTASALGVVVLTGVVGRFIYGLVRPDLGEAARATRGLKQLMRAWRVFHASLAGFLVVAIAAHIAVSLYLGYGLQ
ncbi:FAD-dependent oxidoreductase [Anaeromyxobacter paludicola]|uniref:4Fe-4S ferredoxin-type domain-containing protein n=1 Tax=Anaeromyxobacter paludicola TaxID=2918171 RepID=A0ABM7XDN2_9BACT|nr:FAD-dependent oxidoreductase [Anaeromyxobacter paludicola]BDG09953.1 hypothetical protein AMPC_30660 [Anaeromyxobacter paludicola]